jgi:hypothetical protein
MQPRKLGSVPRNSNTFSDTRSTFRVVAPEHDLIHLASRPREFLKRIHQAVVRLADRHHPIVTGKHRSSVGHREFVMHQDAFVGQSPDPEAFDTERVPTTIMGRVPIPFRRVATKPWRRPLGLEYAARAWRLKPSDRRHTGSSWPGAFPQSLFWQDGDFWVDIAGDVNAWAQTNPGNSGGLWHLCNRHVIYFIRPAWRDWSNLSHPRHF